MARMVLHTMPKVKAAKPALNLLRWYDRHRRVLPWRAKAGKRADPYRVLLSEIMLQQTTVPVVKNYFARFLKRWPTIKTLAAADLNDVRNEWSGLGYYRRAKFLHECARAIVRDYKGVFPQDIAQLRALPGIGEYTSNSIAAIAFDLPANVIDGNVSRVMCRMFAIQHPIAKVRDLIREKAASLLPVSRHGDYAQALMDLGATVCTPQNPKCDACPWQSECRAFAEGMADKLPVKEAKKPKPVRFAMAYWIADKQGRVLLVQRPEQGLLAGMTAFPMSDFCLDERDEDFFLKQAPLEAGWAVLDGSVRHTFTHFDLYIKVAMGRMTSHLPKGQWCQVSNLNRAGLPSVARKVAHHVRAAKGLRA